MVQRRNSSTGWDHDVSSYQQYGQDETPGAESSPAEDDFFVWLDSTDVCSLTLVAVAITIVGNIVSGMRPDRKQLGMKVGLGVFLVWVAVWLMENGLDNPNLVFGTIYRGLVFALIISGVVRTFRPMFAAMDEAAEARKRDREWKREQKKREKDRAKEQKEAAERERLRKMEWERNAPERERQSQEAEERRRHGEQEQHRRTEARADALREFNRHREVVKKRFTRKDFDEYLGEFMNDKFSAEIVEQRGSELKSLMQYHVLQVDPPPKTVSLAESAIWFEAQIKKIQELPLDDKMKRAMLSELQQRYAETVDKLMEDLEP
jgi:flagellar biosynthesis GTPase FlhF